MTAPTSAGPVVLRGAALLAAAIEHIREHPGTWYQPLWHCGTRACLAGHIALIAGCRWAHPPDDFNPEVIAPFELDLSEAPFAPARTSLPGELLTVGEAASALLGIGFDEGAWLFDAPRTLDDFERFLAAMRESPFDFNAVRRASRTS